MRKGFVCMHSKILGLTGDSIYYAEGPALLFKHPLQFRRVQNLRRLLRDQVTSLSHRCKMTC